jgi:RNA polymerase sigma-70 factor (ECF subfamily)
MKQENFHKSFNVSDKQAFKLFFETFYPSLCRFASKYLKKQEIYHDIVQDAFLYLWNKRQDFTTENQARSYLYTFVKDRSLNYLRDQETRQKILSERFESETFFRDNLIEEETYQIISHAISGLSLQSQHIIECSLDGLKNREIAEQLGISINTVKTIKLRAFASLREELKDNIFILFMLKAANLQPDRFI